jgi:endonuclease YncB( thermonuclease family)
MRHASKRSAQLAARFRERNRTVATLSLMVLMALLASLPAAALELNSYAQVRDDASLLVKGRVLHLDGLYLPPMERRCRTEIRPIRCGTPAALALAFRIQGFVHCSTQDRYDDDSFSARCFLGRTAFDDGIDLGAYLIEQGWAMASPDAPFEYHAIERIARHHDRGIWGIPVDAYGDPR